MKPEDFDPRKEASLYADFVTGEYFANGKPITREEALARMNGDRTVCVPLANPEQKGAGG